MLYEELDNQLAQWIRQQRMAKKRISLRIIRNEAMKKFNSEEDGGDFQVRKFIHSAMLRVLFRQAEVGWKSS